MRIGIIGAGQIGTTLAVALTGASHEVLVGSRRTPAGVDPNVDRHGRTVRTGTVVEAAHFGEVVILAIPYLAYRELDAALLTGRIVIDTTNYFAERDGHIPALESGSTTSSQHLQNYFQSVRIVKTMHSLNYIPLGSGVPLNTPGRLALPVAGDDHAANELVAGLVDDIGFDAVLTGPLATGGRAQQPFSPVFNKELTAAQIQAALTNLDAGYPRIHRIRPLRVGAVFPHNEIGNDPGAIRDWAQGVEALGYDHILAYDHVLGAGISTRPTWRGYTSETAFHEVFVLFGYLAAITSLELATGVLVLPQRQTALVAKQAAEIDILTNGKLRLGVGVGWNHVEYEALGQPFHERGVRLDEQIGTLRQLWTEPTTTRTGRYDQIDNAGINPLPHQRPIPIWIGGNSDAALQRAGRLGDGWFPQSRPDDNARHMIDTIHAHARTAGRNPNAIGLEPRLSLAEIPTGERQDFIKGWTQLGATHLCINTMDLNLDTTDKHLAALRDVDAEHQS